MELLQIVSIHRTVMYVVKPHFVRESHVETLRNSGPPIWCHFLQAYSSQREYRQTSRCTQYMLAMQIAFLLMTQHLGAISRHCQMCRASDSWCKRKSHSTSYFWVDGCVARPPSSLLRHGLDSCALIWKYMIETSYLNQKTVRVKLWKDVINN